MWFVNDPIQVPLFHRENSETALMRAAEKGYIEIVQLLLSNNAEVNPKKPSLTFNFWKFGPQSFWHFVHMDI